MDIDALPWQADWYRTKVKEALGNRLDEEFRLYFIDHAQHTSPAGVGSPGPHCQQPGCAGAGAPRSQCVGREGREASRQHQLQDGRRPGGGAGLRCAACRHSARCSRVGQRPRARRGCGWHACKPSAVVEVPSNTGRVVAAEWDFDGRGNYPVVEQLGDPKPTVTLKTTHSFAQPGTYFPVLRVTSQREGDPKTPYARIQNLGRVRVVVKDKL